MAIYGSDYCDYDELQTGVRREGLINAIGGWIIKASSAIAVFLSGITIVMTGFKKEYFTGEVIIADAEKIRNPFLMRLAYVGIPLLFITRNHYECTIPFNEGTHE